MKFLFLLITLFNQNPDAHTMYIAVDNYSPNCQILKKELTRDWTRGQYVNDMCYVLDNKRTDFLHKCVIVDITNPKEREMYRVPYIDDVPAYRIGLYKEFRQFPQEMFACSSYPLLGAIAIRNNEICKTRKDWKFECDELKNQALYDYHDGILNWAFTNNIDEVKGLEGAYDGEAIPTQDIINKYILKPTFPKYVAPTLPPYPLIRYPWQTVKEFEASKN
jgi:hypothetical protein